MLARRIDELSLGERELLAEVSGLEETDRGPRSDAARQQLARLRRKLAKWIVEERKQQRTGQRPSHSYYA